MTYRPHMPRNVKAAAVALHCQVFGMIGDTLIYYCSCGCATPLPSDGKNVNYDHRPALQDRKFNKRTRKYTPDANDPRYIYPLLKGCHDRRTFGPGGEKRITTRGGDLGEKAHERAMSRKAVAHKAAMSQKRPGKGRKPKTRYPKGGPKKLLSRPFPKGQRGFPK